ncbi:MAG TPA: DUF1295 domain-containing protein [Methylomirabilota bacterium]|nr:DUF1295 domain-containing protein [Methylomirabilota bacterium]
MPDRNALVFVAALVVIGPLLVAGPHPILPGLAAAVAAFTGLWLLSLALGRADIVDVAWGPGFVLVGAVGLAVVPGAPTSRGLLVLALVALWAARLALHIGTRNAGAGEDFRYRKWREEAGGSFWWVSYLRIFLLQALTLWVVSSPVVLAQVPGPRLGLRAADLAGLALFAAGFLWEAVADRQLTRFKADPANRGEVLRSGLWGLSRHPNYFGEAVLWWGIGLLALPSGGLLALAGPAVLTFALLRVSGVAMLDAALVERKPGYADYIRSTPAFFPRPRRLR